MENSNPVQGVAENRLLVERFGSNLRNQVAHGLMDYTEFYSWQVIYLWWLVLRLCCLPVYARIYKTDEKKNDDSSKQEENLDDEQTGQSSADDGYKLQSAGVY